MRRVLYVLLIALLAPHVIFATGAPDSEPASVRLVVGRSAIVDTGTPIARVSLTSADVADALVTGPNQLLINGKTPGTISMFVWERAGGVKRYEVVVARDVAKLTDQVRQLFPDERINIESNGRGIVLSGSVSTKDVSEKAAALAGGYVDKKDDVINLMQIAEGGASNQVLLRVRFAEVSRNALTELGSSFFTGANGYKDWIGRTTTEQFPAPDFDSKNGGLVFSDYLNVFLFNTKHNIGTVIKALQNKGLFQSLAEPNLVAESGKEASFLAGGEFPIPVAQASGQNVAISVQFKEFGIRLSFTPVVTGNRVHLKVKPEVSTLDFNNAVTLQGFRIPALSTRRTETELELEDHQTFAIAGLMSNTVSSQLQKIPGIGDIPILGLLFKSKSAQKDQTELVVMITPEILRNNSVGVTPNLPRTPEPFLAPLPEKKTKEMPPAPFKQDQRGEAMQMPQGKPAQQAQAPQAPNPAAAAAAMSALTPQGPKVMNSAQPGQPQQPAITPMAPMSGPAVAQAPMRPMTADEKKALLRARDLEEKQRRAEAKQAQIDAKAAAEQKEKDDKLAKEQAKRDAENAKKAAEIAKKEAEEAKKQQKAIDEAAAKLKAAEAAYQAELAKKQPKQEQQ